MNIKVTRQFCQDNILQGKELHRKINKIWQKAFCHTSRWSLVVSATNNKQSSENSRLQYKDSINYLGDPSLWVSERTSLRFWYKLAFVFAFLIETADSFIKILKLQVLKKHKKALPHHWSECCFVLEELHNSINTICENEQNKKLISLHLNWHE